MFLRRHFLRVFERATICKIRRDPRCPKRMIADRRENANGCAPFPFYPPRVALPHRRLGECDTVVTPGATEQETFAILDNSADQFAAVPLPAVGSRSRNSPR